ETQFAPRTGGRFQIRNHDDDMVDTRDHRNPPPIMTRVGTDCTRPAIFNYVYACPPRTGSRGPFLPRNPTPPANVQYNGERTACSCRIPEPGKPGGRPA